MKVAPDQLKPGCLLLSHVLGKTNRPIIPKDTVLTEEHIDVLKTFLIKEVNVSTKLASGETFNPKPLSFQKQKNQEKSKRPTLSKQLFEDHYLDVVDHYQDMFKAWQQNVPVNMPDIRKLLVPLLNRIDELKERVYTLHHYVTPDNYFYHHSVSVGLLSAFIAKQMDYLDHEWIQIGLAGALSDIGMAKIDEDILHKNKSLTDREIEKIKAHPIYSYRLIEKSPLMTQSAKLAVLQHHERRDGSGYPLGLRNNKIEPYAQIIAVCDIYHAMTSNRHFQEKTSPFLVFEKLEAEQFSRIDPVVVHTFKKSIAHFSIGTKVRLSNGEQAEIIFTDPRLLTRPMVRLVDNGEILALKDLPNVHILEVLLEEK